MAELIARGLFALAVLALPLDVTLRLILGSYNVRLSHIAFAALFLVVAARAVRDGSVRSSLPLVLPAAPYLAAVALSIPGTLNPVKTAGYTAWAIFDVAAVFWCVQVFHLQRPALRRWSVVVHVAAGLAIVAAAAAELAADLAGAGWPYPQSFVTTQQFPRVQGLFYEPSYVGLFVAGLLAVALGWLVLERTAPWALLVPVIVALTAVVLLSTSRSGWLAAGAAYVGTVVLGWRKRDAFGATLRRAALLGGAGLAVAAIVFSGYALAKPDALGLTAPAERLATYGGELVRFVSNGEAATQESASIRLAGTAAALAAWGRSPIDGVGIGGYGGYAVANGLARPDADPMTVVTFNVWTELLAETGVLGFAAAVVFVGVVLTRTLWARADAPPAAAYGVALGVVALVAYQFDQNFLRLDFWFLMAQGAALARSA